MDFLWLILLWPTDILLSHLIPANDSTHLSPLSPFILTITQWVKGLLWLSSILTLMTPFSSFASSFFPWLRYCAYWGCTSWLIPDSVLTHLILYAGRIFRQRCHNCIVCLVVESALHVYKGQLSPWNEQLTINNLQFTHYWNSNITGTHILREFSYNKIRQLCFRHSTALTLDLQVWSV